MQTIQVILALVIGWFLADRRDLAWPWLALWIVAASAQEGWVLWVVSRPQAA